MKDYITVMWTIIQDTIWVTRSFGWKAGAKFIVDAVPRNLNELRRSEKEVLSRFENLTDEDAERCALAFGISQWENREDLNQQWDKLIASMGKRSSNKSP